MFKMVLSAKFIIYTILLLTDLLFLTYWKELRQLEIEYWVFRQNKIIVTISLLDN